MNNDIVPRLTGAETSSDADDMLSILSIPGIPEKISDDLSNAALLFLHTSPPPDLIEELSKFLSSDLFQAILRHSTVKAASFLSKFIANNTTQIPLGEREVAEAAGYAPDPGPPRQVTKPTQPRKYDHLVTEAMRQKALAQAERIRARLRVEASEADFNNA